ncbi:MAG: glycosyltransferase [Actinomycetota bacterium]
MQIWLGGDLEATRTVLSSLAASGALSTIAAEIAQAAGLPELVADDVRVRPATRARAAWQLGEASRAISLLEAHRPGSRLHRAFRAELALITPGTRLRWAPSGLDGSREPAHGVLHLLTNSLPHTQSGYTVRSHAVLRAQRDAGLAPTAMTRVGYPVVVGGLGAATVDEVDGIRYHRALPMRLAATPDGRLTQQADALLGLAARIRPAVLQTTTHYPNAIVVREVAEALGIPWAYEVRGMLEQTWVAGLGSDAARARALASERYRLTREREAELATAADAVFTLASSMRDDLTARGVPREHIELVPNGIDEALLHRSPAAPADAREALGLPRDGFWVGSTSSLVDYEGFDVLLEAVSTARADGHDIRVLLVGDGAARKGLESSAAKLGLTDVVRFAGRVPRDAVDGCRDALDLFVVPRLDREVTRTVAPLKPIEAMASGRPLVVSALAPLLEVVGEELVAEGATVPAGDASALAACIMMLAGDDSLRARLVELGGRRAMTRTWSSVAATYARTFAARAR